MSSAAHIREQLSGGGMSYRASQHHSQGGESGQAARYNPAPSMVTDMASGIRGFSYQPYQNISDHHDQNAAVGHVYYPNNYGELDAAASSRQPQQYSSHHYQPQSHEQQPTTSFRSASSLAYSGMNNAESLLSDSANYNVSVHNRLPRGGTMRGGGGGGGYLRPPSSRPPSTPRGTTADSAEYLNGNNYYHSTATEAQRSSQHIGNSNNNVSEVAAVAGGQPTVTYVHQDYGVRRVSPTRAGTGQYFPSNLSRHEEKEEVNYQSRVAGVLGAGADVGDVVATPTASFAVPPPPDPTPFHITPPYSHQPISMNNASDAFYHHYNQQHINQVQGQQQQQQQQPQSQYFESASSHNPTNETFRAVAIAETRLTNIAQDVGATAALHAAMSEMEKAKNAEIRALEEENSALREMLEREAEAREVAVKALCSEAATASYLTHAARKRDLQAAFWHWRMRQYKRQSQRMSKTIVQTYDAVSATISKSSVVVDAKVKSISKAVRELAAAEQQLVMRRIEFFSNIDEYLPDDAVLGQPSRSGDKGDKGTQSNTKASVRKRGHQRGTDRPTEEELLGEVLSSPVRRQKERAERRRSGNSEDQGETSRSSSSSSSSPEGEDGTDRSDHSNIEALSKSTANNKKVPPSSKEKKEKERRNDNRRRKNKVTDDDEKGYGSSDNYSVPDHIVLLREVTRQYKDLSINYANDVDTVVQKRMSVVAAYLEAIADQLNLASSLRNHLRPFDAVAKTVLGLRGLLNERVARSRAETALALAGRGGVEGVEKVSSASTSGGGGRGAHRDGNPNNNNSSMPYPQPANPLDYTPSLVAYASTLDVYKDAYHGTIAVTALPPLLNLLRAGIERVVGDTDADDEHSFDDEGFGFNLRDFSPAPRRVPTALGTTVMNLEDPLRDVRRGSPHAAQTIVKAVSSYFYDGLEQVMLQSPMTATANKVLVHYLDAHVRLPSKGGSLLSGDHGHEDGGTDNEHAALAAGTLDAPVELSRCRLYINPLVKSTRTFTEEMAYLRREGVAAAAEAKAWGLRAEEAAAIAVGNSPPFDEVNSAYMSRADSPRGGATRSTHMREASSSSAAGWSGAGGPSAARVAGVLNDRGTTATNGRSRSGVSDARQPPYRVVVVGDEGGVVTGEGGAALISRASPLRTRRQGPQYDADEVAAQLADSLILKDSKNPLRNKWDGVGGFTSNPLSHIAHIVGRRSPVRPQPQSLGRSNSFTFSGTSVGGGGYSLSGGGSLPRSSSVPNTTAPNIPPVHSAQQHASHHYPNTSHSSFEPYSKGAGPATPLTRALSNPSIQNQADPSFYHNNHINGAYHRAETPISSRQNSQPRGGGGVGGDELGFNPQQQLQFTPISGPNSTAPQQQQQQQQRPQYYAQPTGSGLPPTAPTSTSSAVTVPTSGAGGSLSRAASPHPYPYASLHQQGVRGGEGGNEAPSTASEGHGRFVQPSLYSVRPPAGAASSQSLLRTRSQSDEGTTAAFREPSRDEQGAHADRGVRRATVQSSDVHASSSLTSLSAPSRDHHEGVLGETSVATVPKAKPTTTTAPTSGGTMDREGVSGSRQQSVDVETVSSVSGTNTRDNSPIRGGSTATTVIGGAGASHS